MLVIPGRCMLSQVGIALALCMCGCADTSDDTNQSTQIAGGTVAGRTFQVESTTAGPQTGGGIVVNLADYPIFCGEIFSGAKHGSVLVALLLSDENSIPGEHAIPDEAWDSSVRASVTTWIEDSEGTVRAEPSTIVTSGKITLSVVDESAVTGSVNLSADELAISGPFSASWCAP